MTDLLSRPVPKPGVRSIAPYVPGKAHAAGGETRFKLSSNETPLGPSAAAVEAYREAAAHLELYPDGAATALRQAIADTYGLDAERIICGAGSDEVLQMLTHTFVGPGDETVMSEYGFLVYPIATQAVGATCIVAKDAPGYTVSVDNMLAAVTERTRMVFLANPNNPTGTYIPISEVRRLHAGLPGNVVLVLDAAYCEYVRRNDYEAGIELASEAENVILTRTFSKIHGLAGLRIGWGYGPRAIIEAMNRIRGPFNLSAPAIAAGVAAIRDRAHVASAADHNTRWLSFLTGELEKLGLTVTPSVGNFILVHFPADAAKGADAADLHLQKNGIIVRKVGNYGLPDALRITIGTEEANRAVVAALTDFLA